MPRLLPQLHLRVLEVYRRESSICNSHRHRHCFGHTHLLCTRACLPRHARICPHHTCPQPTPRSDTPDIATLTV
jgi:hypothetical protein